MVIQTKSAFFLSCLVSKSHQKHTSEEPKHQDKLRWPSTAQWIENFEENGPSMSDAHLS